MLEKLVQQILKLPVQIGMECYDNQTGEVFTVTNAESFYIVLSNSKVYKLGDFFDKFTLV